MVSRGGLAVMADRGPHSTHRHDWFNDLATPPYLPGVALLSLLGYTTAARLRTSLRISTIVSASRSSNTHSLVIQAP